MRKVLRVMFEVAGLVLGLTFIWPDVVFFYQAITAAGNSERLTFLKALERGEHVLVYSSLVLLPGMHFFDKILAHKVYSALTVLLFAALSLFFARVLHSSIIDGYVFLIAQRKVWASVAYPASIFVIVGVNWLMAFSEMYRLAKVAGK